MDLVEQLRDPAAYGVPVDRVEHLQTHISDLFFVGEFVFKVKRSVDLGFLDYTTLANRRFYCEEELRLNRRLAAEIYLAVVPIVARSAGGVEVEPQRAGGTVVDYAVKMRRLPAARMFDHLLDKADIDNDTMRGLAGVLSAFHSAAATGEGVDEHGSIGTVQANCVENFAQTAPEVEAFAGVLSATQHGFLAERASTFLDDQAALFERRVAAGRIRDGHGDLHAGNICVLPDRIVIYDCIEFAARFRCGDVAADLAFLLMDMDRMRYRGFARYLQREYVERSGDEELAAIVGFYKTYRAVVRGKVEGFGIADHRGEARAVRRGRAMGYFHLAVAYELPPALIVGCGMPGSGKSYTGKRVVGAFDSVVLNSDRIRKRLAGIAADQRAGEGLNEGLYAEARSTAVYAELVRLADEELGRGRTVFVDAGCRTAQQRRMFVDLANRRGVALVVLHVATPRDVALGRIEARAGDRAEASDADRAVYLGLEDRFEAPEEIPADQRLVYDGMGDLGDLAGRLIDNLIRQRTGACG